MTKTVGPCKYETIENELRLSGMLFVRAGGKVGYIDALGKEMVPCVYDSKRDDFRDGKVLMTVGVESYYIYKNGGKGD